MYCSFPNIWHAGTMWSTVSSDCWHTLNVQLYNNKNNYYYYYLRRGDKKPCTVGGC
jgi:hypothetical protein